MSTLHFLHVFRFMLPIVDNAGVAFPESTLSTCLTMVDCISGVHTVYPEVAGVWTDPESGVTYRDRLWPVEVAIDPKDAELLTKTVARIGVLLDQVSMYLQTPEGAYILPSAA